MTQSAADESGRAAAPNVSVVICFYNAGNYLSEAIESVDHQTRSDWELILVDDGSTDRSSSIGSSAATSNPGQIRYLQHAAHANLGKSSSRNLGLHAARGKYVVFLDADDILLPHKLEHQSRILDRDQRIDAVYGRTWYWHDGPAVGKSNREQMSRLWVGWNQTYEPPALLLRFLRQPGSVPCLCAWMVRREVLLALRGFDESIQHLYEDQVLISKLALKCRVHVDLSCGERYRQHAQSSSRQAERSGLYHPWRPNLARRNYLQWLQQYILVEQPNECHQLSQAMRRAWQPYRHPNAYRWIAPAAYLWKSVRDRCAAWTCPEPPDPQVANRESPRE